MSENRTIQVLMIEDNADDVALVKLMLRRAGLAAAITNVDRLETLRQATRMWPWDIVLCDHAVPGLDIDAAMELLREQARDAPLVLVTGTVGEEAVADIMRRGAVDVVLKANLATRLALVVEREVASARRRRAEELRRNRTEALLAIFNDAVDWRDAIEASLRHLAIAFDAEIAGLSRIFGEDALHCSVLEPVAVWATERFEELSQLLTAGRAPTASTVIGQALAARTAWLALPTSAALDPVLALQTELTDAGIGALVCHRMSASGQHFALWMMLSGTVEPDDVAAEIASISQVLQPALFRKISETNRNLLSNALEAAHSGVLITEASPLDEPGPRIVYVNAAVERMSGYRRAELIGRSPRMLQGPNTDRRQLAEIHDALAAAQPISVEVQNYRRDGTPFWTQLEITPVADREQVTHFIAIQTDISDRRKREHEARQRDASFRLLFDNNPMPMWVYDAQTLAFIEVNAAAIHRYGWSRAEFLTRTADSIRVPEERSKFRRVVNDGRASGLTAATHVTASGEEISVRLGVERIDFQGRAANLTVVWDVTEVELARDELRRKNETLAQLTESLTTRTNELTAATRLARIGTWRMDYTAKRIAWSPEVYEIFGQDPDKFHLSSQNIRCLVHPEDLDAVRSHYSRTLRDGAEYQVEYRILRPNGDVRVIRELSQSELDDSGQAVGISGVVQDITEQKIAADALLRSEKLKTLGQITGGIAHDFNNLLTVIGLNLEEALAEEGLSDDLRNLLQPAMHATSRSSELTGQLLSYARRQSLRPIRLDLQELAVRLRPLLVRAVGDRHILELAAASTEARVLIDPGQFENALMNLTINARDALTAGGRISISIARERLRAPIIGVPDHVSPGEYVRVRVSDNGSGIRPDQLSRIFEPFFTTKPLGNGSGLGLSMVYGFVRQSGGATTVHSALGKGTQFNLYFPVVEEIADHEADGVHRLETQPNLASVLLVEDRSDVRNVIQQMLRRNGFDVTAAGGSEEALDILGSRQRVDVLLSDILLCSRLNGPQLAAEAEVLRPGLISVLMTGDPGEVDSRGLRWRVLRKPFRVAALVQALRQAH